MELLSSNHARIYGPLRGAASQKVFNADVDGALTDWLTDWLIRITLHSGKPNVEAESLWVNHGYLHFA
jgi:hypothetical protein